MMRSRNLLTAGPTLVLLGLCLAVAPAAQAFDSDLSTTHSVADPVSLGQPFTVTVGYANAGPAPAGSAYINSYFIAPMGLDAFIDDLVNGDGDMYTAIQTSAEGTDTLGNAPLLFWDDFYCEDLFFQVQRSDSDTDANPVEGLNAGVSATFTYQTTLPMDSPKTGTIEITSPASIAQAWTRTNPATIMVLKAGEYNTYASSTCSKLVGTEEEDICEYITDNCWGARISQLDAPIEADFQVVSDGSADPTQGCSDLVGFTPGNIAVIRRGGCEFGVKGFNAEQAGASAVFMVNTTQCSDEPPGEDCVLNMGPGVLGALVTIPMSMVSYADGEEVIATIQGGATVHGMIGSATKFAARGYAFLAGASDDDPNPDNDMSSTTVDVVATPDPPVAGFTYLPAAPVVGSPVIFTDASTGGAPTSWTWDFGDSATSTEPNPSHTYADAGTYDVTLTVSNDGGSDEVTRTLTVTLPQTLENTYFIPAAALAAGAEGSFFQTDVDINSDSASDASYAFLWLPRGVDNSTPTQSATFSIAAGASVRYENVLEDVFGFTPDQSGALAVLSNTTNLNIMSRTYNVPTVKIAGTFGQALPGIPADELIMQGETKRIIFMSENADLRANLGCVNGVNDSVRIAVTLYDDAGAVLETRNMDLGPWSNNQFNQLFADYAPTNGYADVKASKPGAAYYCYGSVLDNGSNDPTTILPTEYGAISSFVTYFVPAAALAAGAEGSFFQTDVDINNAGDTMTTYQFMWLPRGIDNSAATTSEFFTLAAGASVRYENVLAEVFSLEPDAAGALGISADSSLLGIMSRTYNVPTVKIAGTFGQAIPGIPADNLIMQGESKRIIFMSENDDLRANLGCVNGVNDSVRIAITLYDDAGAMLETRNMDLGPWSNNQFNQLFADYAPTNGYADVKATKAGAAYFCYGSVLDNGSNDPTTILPQ